METRLFIKEYNSFYKENKEKLKSLCIHLESYTINIVTLEEKEILVEWSILGWTIISVAGKTNGLKKKTYESLETLLKHVSLAFDEQWIGNLLKKLLKYEKRNRILNYVR
ncbi:hypothetical protein PNEG_02622 [Pneumocystis murina B123]|uniref:GSKIP domain-containing protein n=1 Tax=Pneumocystis murina (strain B123) TaxID=1069680 RepID=M7P4T4_PNEMU|nr:hypothetical protein PNEG_02622 [Pneumocystis murina B123]EMR08835.1 hypothetical protein PNEG_02622 [Pneumocystis murina B123]